MTTKYYHEPLVLRETKNGKTWVKYSYFESFGRERSEAYSWGNKEKRGNGYIWLNKNESLEDGINRRKMEYC